MASFCIKSCGGRSNCLLIVFVSGWFAVSVLLYMVVHTIQRR